MKSFMKSFFFVCKQLLFKSFKFGFVFLFFPSYHSTSKQHNNTSVCSMHKHLQEKKVNNTVVTTQKKKTWQLMLQVAGYSHEAPDRDMRLTEGNLMAPKNVPTGHHLLLTPHSGLEGVGGVEEMAGGRIVFGGLFWGRRHWFGALQTSWE